VWEDHRPRSGRWKGSSGGEVISFSGCDDHQTSADTSVMIIDRPLFTCSICGFHKKEERVVKMLILLGVQALSKVTSTGAMTYCFIPSN